MKLIAFAVALLFASVAFGQEVAEPKPAMIVAVGAGGTDQYAAEFATWALQWRNTASQAGIKAELIGGSAEESNAKEHLIKSLTDAPKKSAEPFWVVLIGHGTWDRKNAAFNLRGDDITAEELAGLLKPFERPVVIAATFASSGAWLASLSAANRVVITATRSGSEENFSRFGEYFPASFADLQADLDKDGQVSVLEGWITAAAKTGEFYKNEGRLATEHSLLDDNGDGKGTPPDWFQGTRVVKKSKDNASPDGLRANQIYLLPNPAERGIPAPVRQRRDQLELEVGKLREAKPTMKEDEYYQKLEALMLQLAAVYGD